MRRLAPIEDPAEDASSVREQYARIRFAIILTGVAMVAYCLYRLNAEEYVNVGSAIAIIIVSLSPAYLWASGAVRGLPIVPIHLATIVWTHGLPLVSGHPEVALFESDEVMFATLCVLAYCACVTTIWAAAARGTLPSPARFRVLPSERGYSVLMSGLVAGIVYNIMFVGQMISLDPGTTAILRSTLIAVTSVALFALAVRLGEGRLSRTQSAGVVVAAALFIVTQAATLLLISAMVSAVALAVGYSMGGRRIPLGSVVFAMAIFLVLHMGKGAMREEYWYPDPQPVPLSSFPGFFGEWFSNGFNEIALPDELKESQPIYERVSLMHLLLLAQRLSPESVPYLGGESYANLLRSIVPRFIDPDKPSTHDSTRLLSLRYGLQTEAEQEGTQIGWGYLNEGYANFGLAGVVLAALLVGGFLAMVTRHTATAPFMSMQNLLGVMLIVIAVQTDFTLVVLTAAIFQSFVGILFLIPFCEWRGAAPASGRR